MEASDEAALSLPPLMPTWPEPSDKHRYMYIRLRINRPLDAAMALLVLLLLISATVVSYKVPIFHRFPGPPSHRNDTKSAESMGCPQGRSRQSDFSFDAAEAYHGVWMSDLDDDTNLTSLSIPGSHDSMTYARLANDSRLRCQNLDLEGQLKAGLRYVDIRARLNHGQLRVYHAHGDTGFRLADVLNMLFGFLDKHPRETVVVRLKEEGGPVDPQPDDPPMDFEQAFNRLCRDDPETSPRAKRRLHHYDGDGPIPTLGQLRGFIFLLQDFRTAVSSPRYGLQWAGPQMVLEDDFIVADMFHLAEKWIAVRNALERAATQPLDNQKLFLAHVSASLGVLPVDAAAGPCLGKLTGLKDMTGQWLDYFRSLRAIRPRVGIVILDFPGSRAVEAVLA